MMLALIFQLLCGKIYKNVGGVYDGDVHFGVLNRFTFSVLNGN